MTLLGEHLHQVTACAPCPFCAHPGPMDVHETAVRWPCGHTRPLPPLPSMKGCAAATIRRRTTTATRPQ
jgi:hypothetical protein